ncbi:hypothetical protein BGX23_005806 [Mortierella sp. AD031]|nr:hypothetical protein BGX23_005806 [Mortierella sp. AD031]
MTSITTTTAAVADDYVFVPSVHHRVMSMTAPEEITLTSGSVYQPTIYFAETHTVRHMHELCSSEAALQQQLAQNPASITTVNLDTPSAVDQLHPGGRQEWVHYLSDDASTAEDPPQSHKAVFAFLTRNRTTGALEILVMVSFWIEYGQSTAAATSAAATAGVRFPSSLTRPPTTTPKITSAWNTCHLRSSTPEKNSNVNRLPSLWNKFPALPASHNSLHSFPELGARLDNEPLLPEMPDHIKESTYTPTFNTTTTTITSASILTTPIPNTTPNTTIANTSAIIPLANNTEDGPLFRATVVECENHIRAMKATSKRILKAAQAVMETRKAWVAAEEAFVRELEGMKIAESLVDNYWRPLSQHLTEHSEMLAQRMRDLLMQPFSQFYGVDIKAAELQRKSFEEESKEYYSFLSRYMGMKQDSPQRKFEADLKHDRKRRHFELKRLEYWNFLLEMKAGGRKGEELYAHLTEFAEKHRQLLGDLGVVAEELRPDLEAVLESNRQRQEQLNLQLTGRDDNDSLNSAASSASAMAALVPPNIRHDSARTTDSDQFSVDSPQGYPSLQPSPIPFSSSPIPGSSTGQTDSQWDMPPTNNRNITGIRDLEHQDIDAGLALGRRKEGFLFATNRPSPHHNAAVLEKPNNLNTWRKYWCVLSEGQLHEYSQWKRGITQPHNEPINLRIATVRSCRNQDRRFCFEVITPKFRRVYQATSADDMNSWINVISNAIQSLLNGTSSCRNLNLQYTQGGADLSNGNGGGGGGRRIGGGDYHRTMPAPDGKGLMAGLGGMARASMEQFLQTTSLPASLQDRVQPGQAVGKKRGGSAADGLNEMGQIILPLAAQATSLSNSTTAAAATSNRRNSMDENSSTEQHLGSRLLQTMRDSDLFNTVCAECGAKNPDWCVINLGILVCIECSGIHRSLGTHISKVRSFTLDTNSYTKDLVEFIRSVGNSISNQIWEANLFVDTNNINNDTKKSAGSPKVAFRKPVVNDSREYKMLFIRKKYVERAFVERSSESYSRGATEALFEAVSANDIPATIAAYAAGGNLNAVQRADHASDSGPFVEEREPQDTPQDVSRTTTSPPLPPRNDSDTFNLGTIPNTADSPLLSHSLLRGNGDGQSSTGALDESVALSETSSQLSRSTLGSSYPVSTTDRNDDLLQSAIPQDPSSTINTSPGATLEIRPRPTATGGRCISSVMVMQTSPLLIALRHSVPFSFDPQYEVYPLAEFLMQNGAASNMSVKVKVFSAGAVEGPFTASSSSSSVAKNVLGPSEALTGSLQGVTTVKGPAMAVQQAAEELTAAAGQSIIERDVPLPPSSSIGARLFAGTSTLLGTGVGMATSSTPTTTATVGGFATPVATVVGSGGTSVRSWTSTSASGETSALTDTERKAANRRSVGQIVELRGEDGITALEYLRAKSVARGDIPSPSPSPAPPASSLESNLPGHAGYSRTRPQSLKERGSLLSSMSTGLINTLALSPRQRPTSSEHPRSNDSLHPPLSSSSNTNQDISTLFQKRRDSDGGLGSGFFATMKASSNRERERERAAAKAQARKSGDFSGLSPIVITPGPIASPAAQFNSNGNGGTFNTMRANNNRRFSAEYGGASSNLEELSPTTNTTSNPVVTAVAVGPSRTQKMKASLTKSIRLSAAYFKNNKSLASVIAAKEDRDRDRDHPPPVVRRLPLLDGDLSFRALTIHQTTSTRSVNAVQAAAVRVGGGGGGMSSSEDDEESDPDDEYTVEELLARQEARPRTVSQPQSQLLQQGQQEQKGSHFLLSQSRPSPSFFSSSISFSSTPNLNEQAQRGPQ